jgi:hypothetical protein
MMWRGPYRALDPNQFNWNQPVAATTAGMHEEKTFLGYKAGHFHQGDS